MMVLRVGGGGELPHPGILTIIIAQYLTESGFRQRNAPRKNWTRIAAIMLESTLSLTDTHWATPAVWPAASGPGFGWTTPPLMKMMRTTPQMMMLTTTMPEIMMVMIMMVMVAVREQRKRNLPTRKRVSVKIFTDDNNAFISMENYFYFSTFIQMK